MWLFVIIGFFIIYRLYMENKDAGTGNPQTSQNSVKKRSASASTSGSGYSCYDAPSLCRAYKKALSSHNQAELLEIVDHMIGNHWASSYSDDYDSAMLYESAAKNSPFHYPTNGPRDDCRGLSLIEIFYNQNAEIRARKQGKAPYSTPLPYKPKQ